MENVETTAVEKKDSSKKTIVILAIIIAVLLLVIAGLVIWYFLKGKDAQNAAVIPVVRINTPGRISENDEEIVVPVTLSDMPQGILFPAVSFSISFDNYKLELVGIEPGNIQVLADENPHGSNLSLPDWKLNKDFANQSGHINVMYFDSTAGRYAFTKDGFDADEGNILFSLVFSLRNNVKNGEIFDIIVDDACFAASDETQSLAMTQSTLRAENGKIVVG